MMKRLAAALIAGAALAGTLAVPGIAHGAPTISRQLLALNDFDCRDPVTNCVPRNFNGQWVSATSGQTLILSARLSMPHGAQLVDVWCHFNDLSKLDASFRVLMRPVNYTGIGWNVMTNAISTSGASMSVQTLQASSSVTGNWTPSGLTADNAAKAFFVEVTLPFEPGFTGGAFNGNNLALHGCYYDYMH